MAGESPQLPDTAPDPSVYTMEAIARQKNADRDYVDLSIAVLRQRMDDNDEATKVLHETVTRTPTEIQTAVGHLHDLMSERFDSVTTRFTLNDDRQKAESIANETKVNAAFAAQKEAAAEQNKANTTAINKSEDATKEAITKNSEAASAASQALADKIDDLKDRVNRLESVRQGGRESKADLYAAVAAIAAIAAIIVTLVLALKT
jgi:hypothetical protein